MAYNHFDYVPSSTSNDRSVFKFDKPIATSGDIGYLYPMCKPVRMLPGSTLKLDFACEVRSGALIAPLMDELCMDIFAFNVPNRIVWEHWKQFLGAVDDVLFDNLSDYTIPNFHYCGIYQETNASNSYLWNKTLAAHFELPYLVERYDLDASNHSKAIEISALPFRGYSFIWNEYFRPEQLVAPVLFSKTDAGYSGQNMTMTCFWLTFNGVGNSFCNVAPAAISSVNAAGCGGVVLPTFRVHKSLWTSCLPSPSLETLNLLGDLQAPVVLATSNGSYSIGENTTGLAGSNTSFYGPLVSASGDVKVPIGQFYNGSQYATVQADLSQAVLTLNNYLETRMLQNYYNLLNRAGSRYDEIIRNLFHTISPAAIIDIPELIVHKRFTIYRKQVIAQASTNYGDANTKVLGQQGAYIDTVVRDTFFTKSTTEHGYIHILWTIRPLHIRMQDGIEPEWTQLGKFDQYYSCFDGMGDVARYKREIHFGTTPESNDKTEIFGYQEYGAEYKYQRASAIGWLNQNGDYPIPGFTLAEQLNAQPTLQGNIYSGVPYASCFVEMEAFARCLAISSPMVAPQFILDIRLTGEIVHPMPVYNIPGLGELL